MSKRDKFFTEETPVEDNEELEERYLKNRSTTKNKKKRAYPQGKRKYFKTIFDPNETDVEDRIFEDDFTRNREEFEDNPYEHEYEPVQDEHELDQDLTNLPEVHKNFKEELYAEKEEEELYAEDELYGKNSYEKNRVVEKKYAYNRDSLKNGSSVNRKINNNLSQRENFQMESRGQTIIFAVSSVFLIGLAIPVLLIFYLNSPSLDQQFFILGVSYFKLLFIFFISSAIMVYTSLFFLRTGQFTVISVFFLALLCCFPFIAGLRNDLTVTQSILELKLFASWPFFLKPAYLFFEFLLPSGVIIYLFLQIRSIFGRKQHSYAYLCIALYLSIASFIGLSILTRTGQPNIVSITTPHIEAMGLNISTTGIFDLNSTVNETDTITNRPDITMNRPDIIMERSDISSKPLIINDTAEVFDSEPEVQSASAENSAPELLAPSGQKLEAGNKTPVLHLKPTLEATPVQSEIEVSDIKADFTEIEDLRIKAGHLLSLISKIERLLEEQYKGLTESGVKSEVLPIKSADDPDIVDLKSALGKTANLDSSKVNLEDVERELQDVSAKLDMILKKISMEKESDQEGIARH
ncbi:MAG: hypothetical protein HQK62_00825 [Desulfamplus sp.]|nr:hypothetical protein [Desulfamplus sp.]